MIDLESDGLGGGGGGGQISNMEPTVCTYTVHMHQGVPYVLRN